MGDGREGDYLPTDAGSAPLGRGLTVERCKFAVAEAFADLKGQVIWDALKKARCEDLVKDVVCKPCDSKQSMPAYYDLKNKQILLCSNSHRDAESVKGSVMHELVHVYDACKKKNLYDCKTRACSEIRAAKHGECAGYSEKGRRSCTRESAYRSTKLFCKNALTDVDTWFEKCYNDDLPFAAPPPCADEAVEPSQKFRSNS